MKFHKFFVKPCSKNSVNDTVATETYFGAKLSMKPSLIHIQSIGTNKAPIIEAQKFNTKKLKK